MVKIRGNVNLIRVLITEGKMRAATHLDTELFGVLDSAVVVVGLGVGP